MATKPKDLPEFPGWRAIDLNETITLGMVSVAVSKGGWQVNKTPEDGLRVHEAKGYFGLTVGKAIDADRFNGHSFWIYTKSPKTHRSNPHFSTPLPLP